MADYNFDKWIDNRCINSKMFLLINLLLFLY